MPSDGAGGGGGAGGGCAARWVEVLAAAALSGVFAAATVMVGVRRGWLRPLLPSASAAAPAGVAGPSALRSALRASTSATTNSTTTAATAASGDAKHVTLQLSAPQSLDHAHAQQQRVHHAHHTRKHGDGAGDDDDDAAAAAAAPLDSAAAVITARAATACADDERDRAMPAADVADVSNDGHDYDDSAHLALLDEPTGTGGGSDFDSAALPLTLPHRQFASGSGAAPVARRPLRIILIRHGESEANVNEDVYCTVPDNKIQLTERGRMQAREAGVELRRLVGEQTVRFVVSPFARTRATYAQLLRAFDPAQVHAPTEDPRIREQEFGNLQTRVGWDDLIAQREKVGRFFFRFPQGESGADVYDRVSAFLETLFRSFEYRQYTENVVLVSHGLFIRLFLMRYFRWSVDRFERLLNFGNCEYVVLQRTSSNRYEISPESQDRLRWAARPSASIVSSVHPLRAIGGNGESSADQSPATTESLRAALNGALTDASGKPLQRQ